MLEQIDQQLFLYLNSVNSPFCDKIMATLSMTLVWVPLYLSVLIYLGRKYGKRFWIILLFVVIAAVLSDRTSVLIKNAVDRPRPCHEPTLQGLVHIVNGYCGGMFGFVSSHATNSFNAAFLSLMFIRRKWYTVSIILWASAVSYSRIYLGVHYPGDVICGAVLGALIGLSVFRLWETADKRFYGKNRA